MITAQGIRDINQTLKTIDQKGKPYVMVNERVKAFRELAPLGTIVTSILHMDDDKVVMQAVISDEDKQPLASGIASEKFDSSFITKTSAFEVCETSAVGRALGFLGIGIDGSMASAEELTNALIQQEQNKDVTDLEKKSFIEICKAKGVEPEEILKSVGWKSGQMTKAQHGKALKKLVELDNA